MRGRRLKNRTTPAVLHSQARAVRLRTSKEKPLRAVADREGVHLDQIVLKRAQATDEMRKRLGAQVSTPIIRPTQEDQEMEVLVGGFFSWGRGRRR